MEALAESLKVLKITLTSLTHNINPGNIKQSSTWACFFEASFVVGRLNIGSSIVSLDWIIGDWSCGLDHFF